MVKQIIIVTAFLLISCSSIESRRNSINSLLKTGKACDEIEANFLIGENKDTLYLKYLLQNMNNPEVCSGKLQYNGISVYQSKMGALKKIANLDSHIVITDDPDSTVIKFFMKRFNYK
jgi:hypothetical protein